MATRRLSRSELMPSALAAALVLMRGASAGISRVSPAPGATASLRTTLSGYVLHAEFMDRYMHHYYRCKIKRITRAKDPTLAIGRALHAAMTCEAEQRPLRQAREQLYLLGEGKRVPTDWDDPLFAVPFSNMTMADIERLTPLVAAWPAR